MVKKNKLETLDDEIVLLQQKKKDLLEKESKKDEKKILKEQKEKEEKGKQFFVGKTEKDFYLIDPANVLAMGKIQNFEDNEDKPLRLILDFIRDNSNIKMYIETNSEVFHIFKDGKKWGKYSQEYYKRALDVAKAWKADSLSFYVTKNKNEPLLMACEDLGFVLAPRVEGDDE